MVKKEGGRGKEVVDAKGFFEDKVLVLKPMVVSESSRPIVRCLCTIGRIKRRKRSFKGVFVFRVHSDVRHIIAILCY